VNCRKLFVVSTFLKATAWNNKDILKSTINPDRKEIDCEDVNKN
jgi:hypothetical protein